ncbi:hypothetical protein J8273_5699 [Carpediemonas membranifera]|uniref:Uncharacterized protein n=1 Tax=Carpediemonas membranifera TaxID=201153 RepID=A0A8J6E3A4_9EUKA|nr:hypothetical protein J8273_5699 [Carpediemonas membranifera]|eukprot:KAG9392887.1 hypothetical protein J8273_5699 [Carpediemonas membranifera]
MGAGASTALNSTLDGLQTRQVKLPESVTVVTSRIPDSMIPFSTVLSPMLNPAKYRAQDEQEDDDTFVQSFLDTTVRNVDIDDAYGSPSDSASAIGLFDDLDDDRVFALHDDDAIADMEAAVPLQAIARAQVIRHTTKLGGECAIVSIGKQMTAEKKRTMHRSGSSRVHIPKVSARDRAQSIISEMSAESEAAVGASAMKGLAAIVSSQQEAYLRSHGMAGGAGGM